MNAQGLEYLPKASVTIYDNNEQLRADMEQRRRKNSIVDINESLETEINEI